MTTLYITGAGVSAQSGIPTFRGEDGFWTIGSKNYTPQQMATRAMYEENPGEFLLWYYHRFVTYRNYGPNEVHYWLNDKQLITQNIDGLDAKAGNKDYISIHGRINEMTLFHEQGEAVKRLHAPWEHIDETNLTASLLDLFKISKKGPELNVSLKPYVLLFDELYTELYQITQAQQYMLQASRIIFIGTSFSVNITQMAIEIARKKNIPIEIVDPQPCHILHANVTYHSMTASEYIAL
ncbi:SIR2 family NAD-dependent protein deacylase [Pseudoalteromonas denitrificans]|uniref:protein acetyllysine N-acetyltransferase n=1 Tax=Pseudoalteromonas denitrificans DSM 6059 TaxID=1123010 RepID=A0A1I1L9I5_9GAMM|nr:Sir2 family NAD-dependent protein deacetylase [Pseudoalteromonas denitrificans]SFC66200.1 NAD-dependent deacetylase [Pseudoalteromonas denitrificans DSM 6059]